MKYYWVKDFENNYRIIMKKKDSNRTNYVCLKNNIRTQVINEEVLYKEIKRPLFFDDIVHNFEMLQKFINNYKFKDDVFNKIIIDYLIEKKNHKEIKNKYNKCSPSISRAISKIKNQYYCCQCKKVYKINENTVIDEGYYWGVFNKVYKIFFIERKENRTIAKTFDLMPKMYYELDNVKDSLILKIKEPIDSIDIKSEEGIYKKIKRIEENNKTFKLNTKKAVVDKLLSNDKLDVLSKKYKVNSSNISRLKNKVKNGDICSCCQNLIV